MKSHFPWHLRPLAPSYSVSATAVFFPGKRKEGVPPPKKNNEILESWEERMVTRQLHLEGGCLDRSCSEARKGGSLLEVSGGHTRRPKLQQLREAGRVYVWQGSVGTFFLAKPAFLL